MWRTFSPWTAPRNFKFWHILGIAFVSYLVLFWSKKSISKHTLINNQHIIMTDIRCSISISVQLLYISSSLCHPACIWHSFSLRFCLYLSASCLYLSLYHNILCLSQSVSLSLCLSLKLIFLSVCVCVCVCLSICMSSCLYHTLIYSE